VRRWSGGCGESPFAAPVARDPLVGGHTGVHCAPQAQDASLLSDRSAL